MYSEQQKVIFFIDEKNIKIGFKNIFITIKKMYLKCYLHILKVM